MASTSFRPQPRLLSIAVALVTVSSVPAITAEERAIAFAIPPQALGSALNAYADAANVQLSYPGELAAGITSPGVSGRYTPEQALQSLLAGTPITARSTPNGTVTLEKPAEPQPALAPHSNAETMPAVTVTGQTDYASDDPYNPDYNRRNASTATKTDTPIMETPVSIQVVPQQVLKDQQAIGLENALKNVSGVQQTWAGGGQYDSFLLRGFPTQEHFRNGVRLPEHAIDLANVEVLKGPSAMLYGRIDPGGMINVVTKRPLFTPYYSLQQQFGSYDLFRTTADATGPVLKSDELAYRLNLSYLDTGSFREGVNRDRFFLAPSLTWKATEATEFNLNLEYRTENVPFDSGLPALNGRVIDVPISRNLNQPM